MDNQHRAIKGYRELSSEEIELMNKIKAKGQELLNLQAELVGHLSGNMDQKKALRDKENLNNAATGGQVWEAARELARFNRAEPLRWASIGKTDIQTGVMALVRAVAQPEGC